MSFGHNSVCLSEVLQVFHKKLEVFDGILPMQPIYLGCYYFLDLHGGRGVESVMLARV